MKSVIAIVLAVLLSGMIGATVQADELDLNDCIELALKNRASIVRARGAEAQAAAGMRSALGTFLPSISYSYSYSKGKETDIVPPINEEGLDEQDIGPRKSHYISAGVSIGVPDFFDVAAAKANHAAAKLDVIASEQDLIYSVKIAYYAYLAAVENVATQQEAVKRAEEQLKLIESKYELGSAALSDVLKQKVQFGNDQLAMLRAENSVSNAAANLAYTIGLDPRQEHTFVTEYEVRVYEGSLDDAITFGLDHNPYLLGRERTLSSAVNSVRSAWSSYLPTVSGYYDYNKFNGTQAYPISFDYSSKSRTYGFSLRWNIFDGLIRERNVSYAKVARNNARADLSDTQNKTVSDIKTAYLDIEALKEQKNVSTENVAAAEEDLKITQEKYNLGAATILDLLDAQVSLKTAQVSLIQVDFDLNLAIAQLENAMGKM